jgi:2-dehydro-3-deoxyglucarate aldolase/4-hydroxy-2-oxoheptanedioate aldolase
MDHSSGFIEKMEKGKVCLGTGITFADPTITEAVSSQLDFVWIDAEHAPFSLETIQGHVMATKGSDTTPLVRVPWNDPVLIKPILDLGAAGVIVPWIRTVEDGRRALAACKYPPEGVRGYGPRRPSRYGAVGGPKFCREQNDSILTILQIEHIEAVRSIREILALPGLKAIVLGLNDLAGSMGLTGQPRHPSVLEAAETVIREARQAGIFPGISIADHAEQLIEWAQKGVQWLCIGVDYMLLVHGLEKVTTQIRQHFGA